MHSFYLSLCHFLLELNCQKKEFLTKPPLLCTLALFVLDFSSKNGLTWLASPIYLLCVKKVIDRLKERLLYIPTLVLHLCFQLRGKAFIKSSLALFETPITLLRIHRSATKERLLCKFLPTLVWFLPLIQRPCIHGTGLPWH